MSESYEDFRRRTDPPPWGRGEDEPASLDTEEVERQRNEAIRALTIQAEELFTAEQRIRDVEAQVEASRERELNLMRRCLAAEKFDAQYENSRLPGDSALSALFLSFEEVLARHNEIEGNEPCDHPDCERTKHDDGFHQFCR